MISKWIWIFFIIFIAIFSYYIYTKLSYENKMANLYSLQITSCNDLINTIDEICSESVNSTRYLNFYATKFLYKFYYNNGELICNMTGKLIKKESLCDVFFLKEIKYYNEGMIYALSKDKDYQILNLEIKKQSWKNVTVDIVIK